MIATHTAYPTTCASTACLTGATGTSALTPIRRNSKDGPHNQDDGGPRSSCAPCTASIRPGHDRTVRALSKTRRGSHSGASVTLTSETRGTQLAAWSPMRMAISHSSTFPQTDTRFRSACRLQGSAQRSRQPQRPSVTGPIVIELGGIDRYGRSQPLIGRSIADTQVMDVGVMDMGATVRCYR
jgi:hypothetical protein